MNVVTVRILKKPTACRQGVKTAGNTQRDEILSQLLEMGSEYDHSVEVLQATDYDLTKASATLAQQSVDYSLSSTPTMDTVNFEGDSTQESELASKRRDRGYGSLKEFQSVHLMQSYDHFFKIFQVVWSSGFTWSSDGKPR